MAITKCHALFVIFIASVLFTIPTQAQSNRYIICDGKQAWLVDGPVVGTAGECAGAVWVVPLRIKAKGVMDRQGKNHQKQQVLTILRGTAPRNIMPVPLSETQLEDIISSHPRRAEVVVPLNSLSPHVREFFGGTESVTPSMQFIISSGTWFATQRRYEESKRFTVIASGANPTIGQILEAVKKKLAGPGAEEVRPYLYLARPYILGDELDNLKTVADYNLRAGAVLWLKTSIR